MDSPYSGPFTSLLLEGLAHYRRGEMAEAMRAWEAAYHTEAGNSQAREFLRTALLRLHAEAGQQGGRAHPWLEPPQQPPPPIADAPRPPPRPGSTNPTPVSAWDAIDAQKTPASGVRALNLPTPIDTPRLAKPVAQPSRAPLPPPPPVETLRVAEWTEPEPLPLPSRHIPAPSPTAPPPVPPAEPWLHHPVESPGTTLAFARPSPADLSEQAATRAWVDTERELQALELRREVEPPAELLKEARERVKRRDFAGALELTAQVLAREPQSAEAFLIEAECEAGLTELYEGALGGLHKTPRLLLAQDKLLTLRLDPTAGFLLSQIDGRITYDELFSLSTLSRLETARLLAKLAREGVIG